MRRKDASKVSEGKVVKRTLTNPFGELEAVDPETNLLNIIVDTPKGSRNKFGYDEKLGLFKLINVLPAGAVFPYDFGFVPATLGGDGDPLDVLLLMDEPAFSGCLVPGRLLGVIEAQQTNSDGERERNDRLIAVANDSPTHRELESLDQVNQTLLDQIEHFFISYNKIKGKVFEPQGRFGPDRAQRILKKGVELAARTKD